MQTITLEPPGIIDLTRDGARLSLARGFLQIGFDGAGDNSGAQIALADISALIISAYQGNLSFNIMRECADRGIVIIICGKNHTPQAIFTSPTFYGRVAEVARWQLASSQPLRKKLWQTIIRAKITHQAQALRLINPESPSIETLLNYADKVLSGDSQNHEARAARIYWRALMGKDFTRDQDAPGINAALNYGYAVFRACVTRSIAAHGLLGMFGLFHSNKNNPWCLADDLLEIWRPIIDVTVAQLFPTPQTEITPDMKQALVKALQWDCQSTRGTTPVFNAIDSLTKSLVDSFKNKCDNLEIAKPFGARPF